DAGGSVRAFGAQPAAPWITPHHRECNPLAVHSAVREDSVIVPHSAARNIKGYSPRFLTRSQVAADRDRELALAWRRRGLDLPSGAPWRAAGGGGGGHRPPRPRAPRPTPPGTACTDERHPPVVERACGHARTAWPPRAVSA